MYACLKCTQFLKMNAGNFLIERLPITKLLICGPHWNHADGAEVVLPCERYG